MDHTPETLQQLLRDTIHTDTFRRITFGGSVRVALPWVKVIIQPIQLRGARQIQFAYYDERKHITKNYGLEEFATYLRELANAHFASIRVETTTEARDIRISKKGKIHVGKAVPVTTPSQSLEHNRVKDLPLPEGKANHLLETMGILTSDGRVKASMRDKFAQINEFLKHLEHSIDIAHWKNLGRPVEILDCGCGSSFLTFAVHHYLNDILTIPARVQGVDVNDEVIRKSVDRAKQLGMNERLQLTAMRIQDATAKPDIVLALHACDTATDDALAFAVKSGAELILSVPCCHHHLHEQLRKVEIAVFRTVTRHGILFQRQVDILTDALRSAALRVMGYKAEVVEFIHPEHTARNLLIRASKVRGVDRSQAAREYVELRDFWSVTPYIETLLGDEFQKLLKAQ